ncbi:MAG: DNA cytosine methyltransferase, partial [Nitrospinae bacterium]|nr:DNA cytosine methyltransferase [Nitrospinota bacterium]
YDGSSRVVIAGEANGAFAVSDPRPWTDGRPHFAGGGHYGVVPFDGTAKTVTGSAKYDNGFGSVADPRLPEKTTNGVFLIVSEDGTWHRPFTTLELAALQGLVDPEEQMELSGPSDSAWRERIGNAVPAPAAMAIAGVMGQALLLARAGETFALSATPIWVAPLAVALSVDQGEARG